MINKNIFYIFILLISARCSRLEDIMWKSADASAFQTVILFPENNSSTNRAQVTFSGTAAVSNPFGVYQVAVSINGGVFNPAIGGESWTAETILPEGTNIIVARAVNTIGETNLSAPCRVVIDTIPPSLVIDNPTNNMDAAPAYSFACTPADAMSGIAGVFVRFDGGIFHAIAGGWTTNITLAAYGTHTNFAYAVDHAGNSSVTQTIVYTCNRPVLTVTAPTNDLYAYGISSYTLKGTCAAIGDIQGVFLSTNNSPYFYISSLSEWTKTLTLVQGVCSTNNYKIYAMDTSGKISLTNSFKIVVVNKLIASDGAASNEFGWCVSLSADATIAIVGVYRNDILANVNQGATYVFRWDGLSWSQQAKLTASDGAAGDYFGNNAAISADGNTVVAGARYDDVGANVDQGSAYVYRWDGLV